MVKKPASPRPGARDKGKDKELGKNKEPGAPFWRKPLAELSKAEWEALCDGCGRCCLVKLEDEDSGRIYHTDIVCNLFDKASCRCSSYKDRHDHVPDCVTLNRRNVQQIAWLPPTCAYKLRAAGEDLPWWHYLVSGSRETVHTAGISCRGRTGPKESEIALDDYPSRIVRWPGNAPRGRGAPAKPEKAGAKSRANAGKN